MYLLSNTTDRLMYAYGLSKDNNPVTHSNKNKLQLIVARLYPKSCEILICLFHYY